MRNETQGPLAQSRQFIADCRTVGDVEAPATLRSAVLSRLAVGDAYFAIDTPLGRVYVAHNPLGLSAVLMAESPVDFEGRFRALLHRPAYPVSQPPAQILRELERNLRGEGKAHVQYDLRGLSEFERAVLMKALEIPYGEVRPYGWIAREIGRPKAVRAVGTALANNPVPIFIPCHRVVRTDGHIGNYGLGGSTNKRRILAAEGVNPDELETLARSGVRYFGSDTTHIFCFPTCRHAQRVTDRHLVHFHSADEATAAGFRPCKVCRPAAIA